MTEPAPLPVVGRRPWLVPVLIAISFVLFVGFQWMGAGAAPKPTGASPRSKGAVGFAGWAELCDRAGFPVVFDRGAIRERSSTNVTVVHTSAGVDAMHSPTPITRDTIWVVAKRRAEESDPETGRSMYVSDADLAYEQELLSSVGVEATLTRAGASVSEVQLEGVGRYASQLQDVVTVAGPELVPVVTSSAGTLVARVQMPFPDGRGFDADERIWDDPEWPGPTLWIVAESDLLTNYGLWRADHAEIALELVRAAADVGEPLLFDVASHGEAVGLSFWRELREFPLVLLPIHLTLLLGLLFWAGAVRFGRPLTRVGLGPSGRRTLIRNTAALLISCGYGPASVRRYVEASIDVVTERYRLPRRGGAEQRARELLPLCESRELAESPLDLLREAQRLESQTGRQSRGRLINCLDLARRTHAWREELLDGS